jgi:hypothetical protein
MMLKSIICVLPVLMIQLAYSQKVDVKIWADRQYSEEAKNIGFTIQVKNKKFTEYYVQDTLYDQRNTLTPAFIFPYLEKKEKGKYLPWQFGERGGGASLYPDPCSSECCNCLLLKKGDSVQFNLNVLAGYKLDKGEYRMFVVLHPPKAPKKVSMKVYTEFKSNYVYFTIN